jgi:hypothetical protein
MGNILFVSFAAFFLDGKRYSQPSGFFGENLFHCGLCWRSPVDNVAGSLKIPESVIAHRFLNLAFHLEVPPKCESQNQNPDQKVQGDGYADYELHPFAFSASIPPSPLWPRGARSGSNRFWFRSA